MPTSYDRNHSRKFFARAYVGGMLAVELVVFAISPAFADSFGIWWFFLPLWILPAAPVLWLGRQRRLPGTVLISAVLATVAAFVLPWILFIILIILVMVQR
jgi:hypothetical protein